MVSATRHLPVVGAVDVGEVPLCVYLSTFAVVRVGTTVRVIPFPCWFVCLCTLSSNRVVYMCHHLVRLSNLSDGGLCILAICLYAVLLLPSLRSLRYYCSCGTVSVLVCVHSILQSCCGYLLPLVRRSSRANLSDGGLPFHLPRPDLCRLCTSISRAVHYVPVPRTLLCAGP